MNLARTPGSAPALLPAIASFVRCAERPGNGSGSATLLQIQLSEICIHISDSASATVITDGAICTGTPGKSKRWVRPGVMRLLPASCEFRPEHPATRPKMLQAILSK